MGYNLWGWLFIIVRIWSIWLTKIFINLLRIITIQMRKLDRKQREGRLVCKVWNLKKKWWLKTITDRKVQSKNSKKCPILWVKESLNIITLHKEAKIVNIFSHTTNNPTRSMLTTNHTHQKSKTHNKWSPTLPPYEKVVSN